MSQGMCPLCCEEFKEHEITVKYKRREKGGFGISQLGHFGCVLKASQMEERKHPPDH